MLARAEAFLHNQCQSISSNVPHSCGSRKRSEGSRALRESPYTWPGAELSPLVYRRTRWTGECPGPRSNSCLFEPEANDRKNSHFFSSLRNPLVLRAVLQHTRIQMCSKRLDIQKVFVSAMRSEARECSLRPAPIPKWATRRYTKVQFKKRPIAAP